MDTKQLGRILGVVMLAAILFVSTSYADEIIFKDEENHVMGTVLKADAESVTIQFPRESIQSVIMGRQGVSSSERIDRITFGDQMDAKAGAVQKIDEQSVTIRFPRESIQSIVMSQEGLSSPQQKGVLMAAPLTVPQPQGGIKGNREGIERHEQNIKEEKKVGGARSPDSSKTSSTQEQLLQEEMGVLQGIIIWRGVPLRNGQVKIVLERYTGFSLAALKRMFSADEEDSPGQAITLVAHTDSQGHYSFSKVPPGYYRIHWMPENESNWYHRLREKPDFEISSGQITIQNIPEKKK